MSDKESLAPGVYTASLTPLDDQLNIDHSMLISHCESLVDQGCEGIVFMGTTGEANSFSIDERMSALEALIGSGFPASKLLIGTGLCAIPETVKLTNHALSHEIGGVLMLPPFYYKNVSDEGIFKGFQQVIKETQDDGLRIYLYHFPQMSATPFSHALVEMLFEAYPHQIIGIKDSSGDWENMKYMCEHFPGFEVFAGSERFLSDILKIGGAGCISASTNLSCKLASELFQAQDSPETASMQEQLNAIRKVIENYPMIPALKHMMAKTTGKKEWLNMRPPQVPLKKDKGLELEQALDEVQFLANYS